MAEILDIQNIKEKIAHFAKERDWEQFHSPKNLAMALSVETGELVEIFQWLTQEQSRKIAQDTKNMQKIKEEIADIMVYLVRICGILDINIPEAIDHKIVKNGQKYPVEKAKGNAIKYSEL